MSLKTIFYVAASWLLSITTYAENLTIDSAWLESRSRVVGKNSGLGPGDTLFITGGFYQNIVLKELLGAPNKPIVVVNYCGQVRFSHQHYRGAFDIKQCRYISVKGLKWNKLPGFVVERAGTGSAIGIMIEAQISPSVDSKYYTPDLPE